MKKLMISTAVLAMTTTGALAAEPMFRAEADPMEIHASEFVGKRVYASEAAVDGDAYDGLQDGWEDIGEINDVILSRAGKVDAILVDVGGFLGIGERQVAVDMDAIRFVADSATADDESDYFLVLNATRASLEEAPAYTWMDKAEAKMDAAGDKVAAAADKVATEAGQAVDATATAVGQAAEATGNAVAAAADKVDAAITRDHVTRDGYDVAAAEAMTTEALTGAKAYDANDEWIGEVSELIVNGDGKLTDAVVDVGGFLGIGEKPVKLAMADLDILHKQDGSDLRVYIPMTKEQLEQLPTYDK